MFEGAQPTRSMTKPRMTRICRYRRTWPKLLAGLSIETDAPTEIPYTSPPFDRNDVDFGSADWISKVTAVQGWLRFDAPLSTASTGGSNLAGRSP